MVEGVRHARQEGGGFVGEVGEGPVGSRPIVGYVEEVLEGGGVLRELVCA